jgi:hypothetical protein
MRGHLLSASKSSGNGGKYGYFSCSNYGESRFRKDALANWFVQGLGALSLAVDGNLDANRKWVRAETNRLNGTANSLKEQKDAIIQKCLKGVIRDAMVE